MALMPGKWERGKTGKALAALWGCSLAVVEQASAEAWRRKKAQDVTSVRAILAGECADSLDLARSIEDPVKSVAARMQVVDRWGPLVGAGAPTKQQIEVRQFQIPDGFDDWTELQQAAWAMRGEVPSGN